MGGAQRIGFVGYRHRHVFERAPYGDLLWCSQEMLPIDRLRAVFLERECRVLGAYAPDGRHLGWPDWQFDEHGDPWPLIGQTIELILDHHLNGRREDASTHWAIDELRRFWVMPHPALYARSPADFIAWDPWSVGLLFVHRTTGPHRTWPAT